MNLCVFMLSRNLCVYSKINWTSEKCRGGKNFFSTLSCSVSGSLQIKLTKDTLARTKKTKIEFIYEYKMRVLIDE